MLSEANRSITCFLVTALLCGAAGGMAWGIRGQYGHETGAMIAGVLIGFVVVLLHGKHLTALESARAVAMFALGISLGGSMTYGQTVGLTHDGPLVGNSEAYRWGMIGLAVKGSVWIGLGSTMFGMALGAKRYRAIELCGLFAAMMVALFVGVYIFNRPFDIETQTLPKLYFSDHWYWEPDVDKPRLERWGGLWMALVVTLCYLSVVKRDALAFRLGLWGILGGALGFPAGQAIQAYNAWHGEWIRSLPTSSITNYFNWWNMMETTFGFVMGAVVGAGVWCHQHRIGQGSDVEPKSDSVTVKPVIEFVLLALHVWVLVVWNFQSVDLVDLFADLALPMIIVPSILVLGGRFAPFLVALPIVMVPIAGKTLRQLSYNEGVTSVGMGWATYVALPLSIALTVAIFFAVKSRSVSDRRRFCSIGLLTATWLYFGLNDAFFHSPWPWKEWTGRTPNGLLFLTASICLTIAAVNSLRKKPFALDGP